MIFKNVGEMNWRGRGARLAIWASPGAFLWHIAHIKFCVRAFAGALSLMGWIVVARFSGAFFMFLFMVNLEVVCFSVLCVTTNKHFLALVKVLLVR
jgi:hypothetical protein